MSDPDLPDSYLPGERASGWAPPRPRKPRQPSMQLARRAPIVAVIAGALVAGGLADRAASHPAAAASAAATPAVPVAAPASALSSSWFCAGAGNGTPGGEAGSVVIANAGSSPVNADVTVVATSSSSTPTAPTKSTVVVPARSSVSVAETVPAKQWGGAVVDANGGNVAVSQVLDGALGRSSQPCASSGSTNWYLPSGQTRINANETILLVNPYPADAIVDLSFSTSQGIEQPEAFQGIDVPPGRIVAENLGAQMRRRSTIATTVNARVGRVVASEVFGVTSPAGHPIVGTKAGSASLADPALPVAGVSAPLASAETSTSWVWPDGLGADNIDEQYVIYNPTDRNADVRLSVGLSQGQAEPFNVTVGPYDVVPIVSEQQARIPGGVPHSATLVSTNNVPVVAARILTANKGSAPSGTIDGIADMAGEQLDASSWVVPAPDTDATHRGVLTIYNGSDKSVQATASILGGSGSLAIGAPVRVPAGARVSVNVPGVAGNHPVVVNATGSVYVEYDLYGTSTGVSLSPAVPLSQ